MVKDKQIIFTYLCEKSRISRPEGVNLDGFYVEETSPTRLDSRNVTKTTIPAVISFQTWIQIKDLGFIDTYLCSPLEMDSSKVVDDQAAQARTTSNAKLSKSCSARWVYNCLDALTFR